MGFRLIVQVALIAASLVIFFTFVQPTLIKIKGVQDDIFQYKDAIDKASQFNARLRELVTIRDSFSQDDMRRLERFIPTNIDTLATMKDIEGIFTRTGANVISLSAKDLVAPSANRSFDDGNLGAVTDGALDLPYQDFIVSFQGDYWKLRDILAALEANDQLLEVVNLSFDLAQEQKIDTEQEAPQPSGTYSMTIRTYSMPAFSTK
jgi:hypothetical protein